MSALLQGHPESGQVISFLPVAAFTGEYRQELFQAIRSLSRARKPVGAMTVDWELGQRSAQPGGSGETYTTLLANAVPSADSLLREANALLAHLQRHASSPVPLATSMAWLVRYQEAWWVVYERGWLRVTDTATAEDLDQAAGRLADSEATVGETGRATSLRSP